MSEPLDTIVDAIAENAAGPQKVAIQGEEVTSRSIDDLIKAANYFSAREASTNGNSGFRFVQFVPGGTG